MFRNSPILIPALPLLLLMACALHPPQARGFCGFYVAKADASLYNKASRVVLVRHDRKTVISMMNDYDGDLTEFALVVPVPVVLKKEQVHIGSRAVFDHIDAYSAPRLVEYFDEDPCRVVTRALASSESSARIDTKYQFKHRGAQNGVRVEEEYTVGEYDIVILSATESDGLERWLVANGYRIPKGASAALQPYIRQDMRFFVAKVNLAEQAKTGVTYLRPLQFAFESEKFMLPIRLGMINASGPQDLLLYVLTRDGRVETTNYATVKLPSGQELPPYIKPEFADFYRAMFDRQVERETMRAVFTEYFWDMGWCDPCAADPLSADELRGLGVFWLDESASDERRGMSGSPVLITRLHVRYSRETFPEDLVLQETRDRENFQGRYVLRRPWRGEAGACDAARTYLQELPARQEREAQALASLTGWEIDEIRAKIWPDGTPTATTDPWWKQIWR